MLPTESSGPPRSTGALMAVVLGVAIVGVALLAFQSAKPPCEKHDAPATDISDTHTSGSKNVSPIPSQKVPEREHFLQARREMLDKDLRGRDISDPRVLEAMGSVPRQRFVPDSLKQSAYADGPLPIGHGQTISQPYIVALMTQLVCPPPQGRALDVGTGSGYQAAVLAVLCKQVYSIEIIKPLPESADERLDELGYDNVTVRHGDGYRGWPEHAPFDTIIVAAAPDHVPQPLIDQLAPGGKLVIPVGEYYQELIFIEKQSDGTVRRRSVAGVAFVPMTGEAQTDEPR